MDRRRFLTLVTAAASAVGGAVLAVPILGRLLAPLRSRARTASPWRSVGPLEQFETGRPARVSFPVVVQDGWVRKTTRQAAWVVRTGDDEVKVLSTVCPHLGCSVNWDRDRTAFECPCHDSGFEPGGAYIKGPARRGLDDLPVRVVGGQVELRWVEYEPGLAARRPLGGGEA